MNNIREKIWYFMIDTKTNEKYSSLVVKKYQIWDLFTNIFLALTTSSSIAAWSIWEKYNEIWLLIIGISQIIIIVKPYFLFPKYIKVFNEKSIHWQHLTVSLEQLWHELNQNYIDEKSASHRFFEYKQKSLNFDSIPDDLIFFNHSKQLTQAENECSIYINKL